MPTIDLGKVTDVLKNKNVLWSDPTGSFMTSGQTIRGIKNILECKNGWLLRWRYYEGEIKDWGYVTTPIFKFSYDSGKNTYFLIPTKVNGVFTPILKQLYISDTYITGHADNVINNSNTVVLFEIVEF